MSILKIKLRELAKRRNERIPGFMLKYVYSEYWKSIIRLVLVRDNKLHTFSCGDQIFHNIDKNTVKIIERLYNIEEKDKNIWKKSKKNVMNLIAIYFPFIIKFQISNYREIIMTTDINIANYNIMKLAPEHSKKICVQHGFFPIGNRKDLDGLNSDSYIVRSESQARTLKAAGYTGAIEVIPFNQRTIKHSKKPKLIIFVGPGFGHSKAYENRIVEIINIIKNYKSYNLIYRPHPRCSKWLLDKLNNLSIEIDCKDKTQISSVVRQFFVGVKSTMLMDAYEIGHEVLLIEDAKLPKEFSEGEFESTATIRDLGQIFL